MTGAPTGAPVDVVIVGAGPVGLYAAYYAGFRGLSVTVIDAQPEPGGQITALYPAKTIHDVAGIPSITGAGLVAALLTQANEYGSTFLLGTTVTAITAVDGVGWSLQLDSGSSITTRALILATGVGGIEPRTLPLGHAWHGKGVTYLVPDPSAHAGQDVVIVGGGDSALDWAVQLSPIARSVTVVHRRKAFRAHAASVTRANELGVMLLTDVEITAVEGEESVTAVVVTSADGSSRQLPADTVIGALGQITSPLPFAEWGLDAVARRVNVDMSMQTNLPGVFAIGDASTHPGKVTLLATGFGEAATAVNHAALLLDPDGDLEPGHSTDESLQPGSAAPTNS